jgi:hypothetical protein
MAPTLSRDVTLDIDTEMKCRICDRKEETINSAVEGHLEVFNDPSRGV